VTSIGCNAATVLPSNRAAAVPAAFDGRLGLGRRAGIIGLRPDRRRQSCDVDDGATAADRPTSMAAQ
jgi:hypothetical protein